MSSQIEGKSIAEILEALPEGLHAMLLVVRLDKVKGPEDGYGEVGIMFRALIKPCKEANTPFNHRKVVKLEEHCIESLYYIPAKLAFKSYKRGDEEITMDFDELHKLASSFHDFSTTPCCANDLVMKYTTGIRKEIPMLHFTDKENRSFSIGAYKPEIETDEIYTIHDEEWTKSGKNKPTKENPVLEI